MITLYHEEMLKGLEKLRTSRSHGRSELSMRTSKPKNSKQLMVGGTWEALLSTVRMIKEVIRCHKDQSEMPACWK